MTTTNMHAFAFDHKGQPFSVAREAWMRAGIAHLPHGTCDQFASLAVALNDDGYIDGMPSELTKRFGWRPRSTYTLRYLARRGVIAQRGRRRIWAAPWAPPMFSNTYAEAKIVGEQRDRIFERDGRLCRACGGTKRLCIDHIVAWSAGGSSDDENLQVLCGSCNSRKQDRTQEHFEELCRKAGIELRGAA